MICKLTHDSDASNIMSTVLFPHGYGITTCCETNISFFEMITGTTCNKLGIDVFEADRDEIATINMCRCVL